MRHNALSLSPRCRPIQNCSDRKSGRLWLIYLGTVVIYWPRVRACVVPLLRANGRYSDKATINSCQFHFRCHCDEKEKEALPVFGG